MDDRLYRSVDDRMLAGVAGGVAERLDADPSIIRVVWALLIVVTGGLALVAYIVMAIVVPEEPDDAAAWTPTGSSPPPGPTAAAAAPDIPPDPNAPTAVTPFAAAGLAAATFEAAPGGVTPASDTGPGSSPGAGAVGAWVAPDGRTIARASRRAPTRTQRSGADRGDDRGALIGGAVLILIGGFFLLRQFVPAIDLGSWWPLILVGIGVILVVVSIAPDRKSG